MRLTLKKKNKVAELKTLIKKVEDNSTAQVKSLLQKVADIKIPEARIETIIKPEVREIKTETIVKEIDASALSKVYEELQALRGMFLKLIGRGGSMNQKISVNNSVMSNRYADINFKGTLTAVDNNTTKQVDITIPDAAASIGGTITGGTTGSVLFINPTATLAQDNANLFWDDSNNRLGIGNAIPTVPLEVTGAAQFGTAGATTPQLTVLGGSGGNSMITLKRTSGATITYSWSLTGGGLGFTSDTDGFTTTNIFGSGGVNQLFIGQSNTVTTGQNTRDSLLSGTTVGTGLGADKPTGNLIVQGNLGTGAGVPGDILLKTGTILVSGTTSQTGSTRLTVKGDSGNVGIGTTSPSALLTLKSTGTLGWDNGSGTADTLLARDAANILAQRNGVNAQNFNVYNTFTSSINNELFSVDWQTQSNVALVGTRTAATGAVRPFYLVSQLANAGNGYSAIAIDRTGGSTPLFQQGLFVSGGAGFNGTSSALIWNQFARVTSSATSGQVTAFSITPTYNQTTATTANTDFLINRTETSVGSGVQLLLDLQVASSSKFSVNSSGLIPKYNNVATAGWGVPAIYASGRSTAQTAAVASVATYTGGASDGSFLVSANANITAFVAGTFNVSVAYTDETNTSRTLSLNFASITGTIGVALAAAGPFEGIPNHIRCKAGTAITVSTTGTFTSLTYNVEAVISQIS